MNPMSGEGWASLCSILTYGKLHLEVERGLGTAIFAVPHSGFASCFKPRVAGGIYFSIFILLPFALSLAFVLQLFFPPPRCELFALGGSVSPEQVPTASPAGDSSTTKQPPHCVVG